MNAITDGTSDAAEVDIRTLLANLAAQRWWIIGAATLGAVALGIIAFTMTPVYRATTVLVPANTDRSFGGLGSALGQLGGIASLAGIDVSGGDSEIEEALAVLRSRQFTESFIAEHELMPVLFHDKWDATAGRWRVDQPKQPTQAKAYRYFDKKIRFVVRDKKTNMVTVQVDWSDRQVAANWANELVRRLNEEMRLRAISRADAYVHFLQEELQSTTNVETRGAIGRLMEAQIKQRMLANVTQEYAFRVVDKALPPDMDEPLRPKKVKMIAAGAFAGVFLTILWILVTSGSRVERRESPINT